MVKRTIRTKKGRTGGKTAPVPKGTRSVDEILAEIDESGLGTDEIGGTLSEVELLRLIDVGATEYRTMKDMEARIDKIKNLIKKNASIDDWHEKKGDIGTAKVSDTNKSEINVIELAKVLKREGKQDLFPHMTTVRIGDAKRLLGEDVLKPITTVSTIRFNTCALKKRQ